MLFSYPLAQREGTAVDGGWNRPLLLQQGLPRSGDGMTPGEPAPQSRVLHLISWIPTRGSGSRRVAQPAFRLAQGSRDQILLAEWH